MIASDIEALSTTIDTKLLNLISKKDSNYQDHFKKSGSLMTTTITTKGHIKEKEIASDIKTTKMIFNNEDITDKLKDIK